MTDSHFPASKNTIMVVDDDPDLVTFVRVTLEDNGYNVMCAYNGKQFFDVLEKQKPDLIILDVMMPEMDGLEVLARLKSAPETSSIPVVLLTAMVLYEKRHMVRYENIIKGYRMEADYYITKPFTETQLMTGINLFLSGDQGHSGESPYQGQLNNA